MRQWFPIEQDVDPEDLHADLDWGRDGAASVLVGMVVGLDGGVAVDGSSSALGGEGDLASFRALRAAADVVLVGAGTARQEDYGPPKHPDHLARRRRERGLAPVVRLALVTRSGRLPADLRVFEDPDRLPLVVTSHAAPADRLAPLEDLGVEVLRHGQDEVDLAAAVRELASRGLRRILCEGGPSLNTAMFRAGLVDEVAVTLAPTITGGEAHLVAPGLPGPVELELAAVVRAGGELLLRHRVVR